MIDILYLKRVLLLAQVELGPLLARVQKPGRYAGGELHSVVKNP